MGCPFMRARRPEGRGGKGLRAQPCFVGAPDDMPVVRVRDFYTNVSRPNQTCLMSSVVERLRLMGRTDTGIPTMRDERNSPVFVRWNKTLVPPSFIRIIR